MTVDEHHRAASRNETPRCWLHRCLLGQYVAMALMAYAGLASAVWATWAWQAPLGLTAVAAGVWVIVRSVGAFSGRWFAPLVTFALTFAVFMLRQSDVAVPHAALILFSPFGIMAMLVVIFAVDLVELAESLPLHQLRSQSWHRLTVWTVGFVVVVYAIVIPTGEQIWLRVNPPKSSRVLEDLTLAQQVRLRSTEIMAAACFCALGATIGSFLNVVAYRLPRGESAVFKRSRCPQCGTQIESRDNVPIIGWLRLGGRCRACQAPISMRYPAVESITAALFLWLYFVELISGGANIPIRRTNYPGVVWIIFYPKWDLIGLYVYHCFVASVLLLLALIGIDRQRVPTRARWFIAAALFIPPMIWPELLPVPSFVVTARWLQAPWLKAGISCLAGGLVGAGLGRLTTRGIEASPTSTEPWCTGQFVSCLAVIGIAFGWQAAIAVTLIALLLLLIVTGVARWRRWSPPRPTIVLLAAFVVHHSLWRLTIEYGLTWWPSHETSLSGWAGVAVAYLALLTANRLTIRPQ